MKNLTELYKENSKPAAAPKPVGYSPYHFIDQTPKFHPTGLTTAKSCCEECPTSIVVCTREKGHLGPHEACFSKTKACSVNPWLDL